MNIHSFSIPKEEIVSVNEDTTLQEAIDLMHDYQFRCVPILDKSGNLFRGTIYRQHIYQHMIEGKDLSLPVTHLLKNATKYIFTDSSFYQVMFAVRDLPYITILNKDHTFFGILTHRAFEQMLYEAWGLNKDSYILTVKLPHKEKAAIAKVTRIIGRSVSINSIISWANTDTNENFVTINLDESCSQEALLRITSRLERRNIEVVANNHTREIFL